MRFSLRSTIHRTPAEVFAVVSDFSYVVPKIDPDVGSLQKVTEGQIGLGTRWRERLKPLGATIVIDAVFTVFEPPSRLGFDFHSMGLRGVWMLTCDADGDSTALAILVHARTQGIGWLLYPLVRWDFPRREKRRLAVLKRLIESDQLNAAGAAAMSG